MKPKSLKTFWTNSYKTSIINHLNCAPFLKVPLLIDHKHPKNNVKKLRYFEFYEDCLRMYKVK